MEFIIGVTVGYLAKPYIKLTIKTCIKVAKNAWMGYNSNKYKHKI